jgi:hypothetical protein
MKTFPFIVALLIIGTSASSQLELFELKTNKPAQEAYTFYMQADTTDYFKYEFGIKNNENKNKNIRVKKIIDPQANTHENFFCFVFTCYPTSALISKKETIQANGVLPEFIGEGSFGLQADFKINKKAGTTTVKYLIENVADPSDTISVTITTVSQSVLPVLMRDFKTEITGNGYALLKWNTSNEINNNYFSIQRSLNGRDFFEIGRVPSVGANGQYQFTDYATIANQLYYYRVVAKDFDGGETFSSINTFMQKNNGINRIKQLAPNPAKLNNRINLSYLSDQEGQLQIQFYLPSGQLVKRQWTTVVKGLNQIIISTDGLIAGTYKIMLRQNEIRESGSVIIQ